jgi:hypothetical protein
MIAHEQYAEYLSRWSTGELTANVNRVIIQESGRHFDAAQSALLIPMLMKFITTNFENPDANTHLAVKAAARQVARNTNLDEVLRWYHTLLKDKNFALLNIIESVLVSSAAKKLIKDVRSHYPSQCIITGRLTDILARKPITASSNRSSIEARSLCLNTIMVMSFLASDNDWKKVLESICQAGRHKWILKVIKQHAVQARRDITKFAQKSGRADCSTKYLIRLQELINVCERCKPREKAHDIGLSRHSSI